MAPCCNKYPYPGDAFAETVGLWTEQVGKTGRAVGIDIKRPAVVLARRCLAALTAADAEYSATAAPARFELHNVFTPSTKHQARAAGCLNSLRAVHAVV